jgi:phosphate transport system substrate-binding protein
MTRALARSLAVAFGGVLLAGSAAAQGTMRLNGAGATFPNPIYSKWVLEYHNAHPTVEINYQAIGSGGGIRQFTDHTVDFGATDGPMTDAQIQAVNGNVHHLPTVLGSVVPTYNIPGVTAQLRFTGDVLAGIWLGQITKWNDSRIAAINPGVTLPDQDIVVAHRSDGSGTTYIWTDYLSKVSSDWSQRVGKGTAVNWPVGLGGQGNPGVANIVKQTPGAIGYVELIYALQNQIGYGLVRNRAGNFVQASLRSTTEAAAAASAALEANTDFRVSITDPEGPQAYPIASFTWLLVPKDMTDAAKARALLEFVWWAVHDGERFATDLSYAPLPPRVVQLEEQRLKSITVNGQPVLPRNYRGR